MRAVIEKEIALADSDTVSTYQVSSVQLFCMKSSLFMHKHIIVRQLIYSYKTFALFTRGLFKS